MGRTNRETIWRKRLVLAGITVRPEGPQYNVWSKPTPIGLPQLAGKSKLGVDAQSPLVWPFKILKF